MITQLETENLILRKPAKADWPAFRAFAMSDQAKGVAGPHSEARAWRIWLSEFGQWDMCGCGMFTVTAKGSDDAIGLIGPWTPVDYPETEIGWMIFGAAEGKGIAYEAAKACVYHGYYDLGWDTAVSYIAPWNTRSRNLAERLGAVLDADAPISPQYTRDEVMVYRHPKPETYHA